MSAEPGARAGISTETRPRLLVIIASTRPGRVGLPVSEWVREQIARHGGFELQVADLA